MDKELAQALLLGITLREDEWHCVELEQQLEKESEENAQDTRCIQTLQRT